MKKFYMLLTAFCFCVVTGLAQVNYNFTATTGTYTSITGTSPTLLNPDPSYTTSDEGLVNGIPIGFTFNYNGTNYTTINLNVNGFASFGAMSADPAENYYTNNLSTGPTFSVTTRPVIAPLWDDLDIQLDANLQYTTTGSAPNRIFTVQWSDAKWTYTATAGSISFQMKLYEGTGVIEFIYQQEAGATSASPSAHIGLTATATGAGNFISITNAGASSATASTVNTRPATGTIYRFTPLSGCSTTPTPGTASGPASACDNTAFNLVLTGATTGTGINVQWQKSAVGANSWTDIAGAVATTSAVSQTSAMDYRAKVTCTNPGGGDAYSNVITVGQTTSNCPPTCTNNISPANAATNVAYQPNAPISWAAAAGATGYDIYFGNTTTPVLIASNFAGTSANITGLAANSTYYWYVAPRNANGALVSCNSTMTSFTTGAPAPPPANNDCTGAVEISAYFPVNGTTISATQSQAAELCDGFTGTADDDVWFKFTALQNGAASIALTPVSGIDAVLMAYSGTCAGTLTNIGCADASGSTTGVETLSLTGLVAGQTYYFRVYSYGSTAANQGTFTLNASGAALPVGIASFNGVREGNIAKLNWTTATEINNAGFELQRSADGRNFSQLSFVPSKANNGNSSSTLTYNFNDVRPLMSNGYYRLKQIDKDGKFNYSNIVLIKGAKVSAITMSSIYPNPVKNELNVVLSSPSAEKINLIITDLSGKVISNRATAVVIGDNNIQLPVASLAAGSYIIKAVCSNGCETAVQKFVKQ